MMRIKKLSVIVCLVLLLGIFTGCSRKDDTQAEGTAVTDVPVDIVAEITDAVSEQQMAVQMDEEQKKNYKVLLDGCLDSEAVYYLIDLTGNGSPELIMGKDDLTVYSCNQGAVTTIGTLSMQEAFLSEQYGLLALSEQEGIFELRYYRYDGEMIQEKVLVSASNRADYDSQAAVYLDKAEALTPYEMADRAPFE